MNTLVKYRRNIFYQNYLVVVMQPHRVPLAVAYSGWYERCHHGPALSCGQEAGQRIQLLESRTHTRLKPYKCVYNCVYLNIKLLLLD